MRVATTIKCGQDKTELNMLRFNDDTHLFRMSDGDLNKFSVMFEGVKVILFMGEMPLYNNKKYAILEKYDETFVMVHKGVMFINNSHATRDGDTPFYTYHITDIVKYYKDTSPSATNGFGNKQVNLELNNDLLRNYKNTKDRVEADIYALTQNLQKARLRLSDANQAIIAEETQPDFDIENELVRGWRIVDTTLIFETVYLTSMVEDVRYYWGEFKVVVNLSKMFQGSTRIHFYNLSKYTNSMNTNQPIPHVIGSNELMIDPQGSRFEVRTTPCLGEFDTFVEEAIEDQQYDFLVNLILSYMTSFDARDTAGKYYVNYDEYGHNGTTGWEYYTLGKNRDVIEHFLKTDEVTPPDEVTDELNDLAQIDGAIPLPTDMHTLELDAFDEAVQGQIASNTGDTNE